jgi:hypothetical protein
MEVWLQSRPLLVEGFPYPGLNLRREEIEQPAAPSLAKRQANAGTHRRRLFRLGLIAHASFR